MNEGPNFVGGFRVLRQLGVGGMGVVDLGEDAAGNRVAIKRLTQIAPELVESLAREVRVLAQIQHPNIVRIVAEGLNDDPPWYAMEFVEGVSLRQFMAFGDPQATITTTDEKTGLWGTQPLAQGSVPTLPMAAPVLAPTAVPEERVWRGHLRIVCELCSALNTLHGAGVVHRDLKPDNILIRSDGTPVIVDFGIAGNMMGGLGRERVSRQLGACGTPAYASPQQLLGKLVDARSDLYSLGCVLFELLTGQLPFYASTLFGYVQAHLFAPVPSALALNPGLPAAVDLILQRLLAKEPFDRLGYAVDLDRRIREMMGWERASYEAALYVYQPQFVGRDPQTRELRTALALPDVSVIRVVGETGVGKSRLVQETCRELEGWDVVSVVMRPDDAVSVLFDAWEIATRGDAQLGSQTMAVEVLLPLDASSEEARERLQALAWRHHQMWKSLTRSRPTVLVFDDANELDPLSRAFVHHVKEHPISDLRLVLCERTDEPSENPTDVPTITVPLLEREEIRSMVQSMLSMKRVPDVYLDLIYGDTGGNPFMVVEMARVAMQLKLMRRTSAGRWHVEVDQYVDFWNTVPISERVATLFGNRLERLSDVSREFLEVCAVVGIEAEPRLIGRLGLGTDPVHPLIHMQYLEWTDRGALRFVKRRMRDLIYAQIPAPRLRALHLQVAEALFQHNSLNLFEISNHFEAAGETQRAAEVHLRAARQAQRSGLPDDAAAMFLRYWRIHPAQSDAEWTLAMSFVPQDELGEKLANLALELAVAAEGQGRMALWVRLECRGLRAGVPRIAKSARIAGLRRAAEVARSLGDHDALAESLATQIDASDHPPLGVVAELEALLPGIWDVPTRVHGHLAVIVGLVEQRTYDQALAYLNVVRGLITPETNLGTRLVFTATEGLVLGELGRHEESLEAYERAYAAARASNRVRIALGSQWNIANQLKSLKRWEEADRVLADCEVSLSYLPFDSMRALTSLLGATIAAALGQQVRAQSMFQRSRRMAVSPAMVDVYEAEFLRRFGDLDAAEAMLNRSQQRDLLVEGVRQVELGFIAVARGQDAAVNLAYAEDLMRQMSANKMSNFAHRVDTLRRAMSLPNVMLWFGEPTDEVPPGVVQAVKSVA